MFPFIIIGIVLYSVFGLFVFIFQLFKLIYLFVTGRNLSSDLEEDIAAKAVLEKANYPGKVEEANTNSQLSLYPSDSEVYTSDYHSPFETKKEPPEENDDIDDEEDDHDL